MILIESSERNAPLECVTEAKFPAPKKICLTIIVSSCNNNTSLQFELDTDSSSQGGLGLLKAQLAQLGMDCDSGEDA